MLYHIPPGPGLCLFDCPIPRPNNPNPPETFNIATDFDMSGPGTGSCRTAGGDYFSGAPCAPQAPFKLMTHGTIPR